MKSKNKGIIHILIYESSFLSNETNFGEMLGLSCGGNGWMQREREREREVVEDTTSLDGLVIPTMLNCYLANAKLPALIDVLPT